MAKSGPYNLDRPCKESWRAKNAQGYYVVDPEYYNGFYRYHRYVYAKHFKLTREGIKDLQVRHLCHNTSCIEITHLQLGTNAENMRDMVEAGRSAKGEKIDKSKLTDAEVKEIRRLYRRTNLTQQELALKFNVNQSQISMIVNRKTWKHI